MIDYKQAQQKVALGQMRETPEQFKPYYFSLYETFRAAEGTRPDTDWQLWREDMWDRMVRQFWPHHGMPTLEQYTIRSRREKRCIECGEPGTVKEESVLIKAVPYYWFCDECAAYWAAKQ